MNLYIFAIGGTGSRILKSLMFLLASGVKINANKIIPIIIDPDLSNGDLERTYDILRKYKNIRDYLDKVGSEDLNFFSKEIDSLGGMAGRDSGIGDFRLLIDDADGKLFQDFIKHQSLPNETKDFVNLLFSKSNLTSNMDIGFKGNPNIGSVVLNQLFTQNSDALKTFASNFKQGDRIFIIGSIFGGTGAAGFPLILKNLRNISQLDGGFPNSNLVQQAKIGALSVLPYFGVKESKDSVINKGSFISKTRAALNYYSRTINMQLDALYYIGDTVTKDYDNNPGAKEQKNNAHFVEIAGALAIIDFMKSNANHSYKEFGILNDKDHISFMDLDKDTTRKLLMKPLSKFYLMKRYLDVQFNREVNYQPWAKRRLNINENTDLMDLKSFLNEFENWLKELADNQISFNPFYLENKSNIKDMIKGVKGKDKSFRSYIGKDQFIEFDKLLNKTERKIKITNTYHNILEMFDNSTEELFNSSYI